MTIVVKGERYDDARDLYASIVELSGKAEEMPTDTPEHNALSSHILDLRAALPENFNPNALAGGNGEASEARPIAPVTPASLPEEDGEDVDKSDAEDEHNICPLCGSVDLLPEQPPQDPTAKRCPACEGIGIVFTGSRVEGHVTRNCPQCTGSGWIAAEPTIPLPPPPLQANAAPALEGAQWNPNSHRWDPPADNEAPWPGATWNGLTGGYE